MRNSGCMPDSDRMTRLRLEDATLIICPTLVGRRDSGHMRDSSRMPDSGRNTQLQSEGATLIGRRDSD
jgi:hypothetical protein